MISNKYTRGFKVPEGYFDGVEASILQKLDESKLPETAGFKTPEGYFDSLEHRFIDAIHSSEEKTGVISLINRRNVTFIVAIAACLAILVTVGVNTLQGNEEQFDVATVTEYIDDGHLDLSAYDVSNLLAEDELESLSLLPLTNETIEDYLLDHIDENNLLLE